MHRLSLFGLAIPSLLQCWQRVPHYFSQGLSKVAQPDRASLGPRLGKLALEHVDRCRNSCILDDGGMMSGTWNVSHFFWQFPKIGDPNIVPQIVGSLL